MDGVQRTVGPIESPTGLGRFPVRLEFDWPQRVVFHLKWNALSVTFDRLCVYTFDRTGRLYGAFVGGRNYRRGLDNRVLEKGRELQNDREVRVCRIMSAEESQAFLEKVRLRVSQTALALRSNICQIRRADPVDALEVAQGWFERIIAWDRESLERDSKRFLEVHRPVNILPPDQYMALVVQPTEGCPWNRCTFCDFYRDRTFRIRSPDELRGHIASMKAFLGEGIRLRRSIFLGDANALTVPWNRLRQAFEVIREMFPAENGAGPTCDRIYAFSDAFGAVQRSRWEIEAMAGMGLRRVYIGLETGHDPLLELVHKQGTAEATIEAVRGLKAGGVQVGVIVLLGLGGDRYSRAHVRDSVRALNALELGTGDMIYFSEMVAPPELEYAGQMARLGVRPLEGAEMRNQMETIRTGLRFDEAGGRPKLATYDIRRFIY